MAQVMSVIEDTSTLAVEIVVFSLGLDVLFSIK